MATREALLAKTLVTLADTLVSEFDVVEFLSMLSTRCVELFEAGEAGLMLKDPHGRPRLVASSSHQMRLLELLELQHDEGPCPEAIRTGVAVLCPDLLEVPTRWPTFAEACLAAGFRAAFAFPMRLRDDVIGALNLIREPAGLMSTDDLLAAQALADVATIGILHNRTLLESRVVAAQLKQALDSRVVIEQAKGVVSERLGVRMDPAFELLRRYSRSHNLRLADCAQAIVDRELDAGELRPV